MIICDYFCSDYLKLFVVIQNYSVIIWDYSGLFIYSMIICDYLHPLFVIICKYLIITLFWLFVIICNYFWLFDDYLVMIIRDYLMIIQWLFGLNYSWLFVIIWCPQQVGRAGSLQKAFAFHRGTSWWLHLCDGARSHDRFFHVHAPGNDCIKARTTPTLLERSCNTYTMTPAPKSSSTCSSEAGCQIRIPKVGLCDGPYCSQGPILVRRRQNLQLTSDLATDLAAAHYAPSSLECKTHMIQSEKEKSKKTQKAMNWIKLHKVRIRQSVSDRQRMSAAE